MKQCSLYKAELNKTNTPMANGRKDARKLEIGVTSHPTAYSNSSDSARNVCHCGVLENEIL
ncbi:uncharacterized protein G2W53_013158 [Senna tora]|uniref:Uncharacterized protein n=1 Tax=Senna tora TaxID=362788 RepID=A0A834WP68_9FABA|nr:uncharacterized protein G2W53_013158 [Senna tora]